MYYEINVSLSGRHFFATAERSLASEYAFINALKVFKDKFPEREGYKITASYNQKVGTVLDLNDYESGVVEENN